MSTAGSQGVAAAPDGVRGSRILLAIVIGVIVIFSIIAGGSWIAKKPAPTLDDLGAMPAFQLQDQYGQSVSNQDFAGYAIVVNFIFTRCDTICPVTSMKMGRLQEVTKDVSSSLKLLSISVDPEYDTPPRLLEYATKFTAQKDRWLFATGTTADVKRLVEEGLKTNMERNGTTETGLPNIAHSGHFVLIDVNGHIRGYYDSDIEGKMQLLANHARFLAKASPKYSDPRK